MSAPIVLFVYCRPDNVKKTITALLKNKEACESDLYIYSDAPKNEKAAEGVKQTRKFIHTIKGFKTITIIERDHNWGLASSLIDGITTIINKYGRVIVVEDDIVTSPYFLKYMNEALDIYENNVRVASIQGYLVPMEGDFPETFFLKWQGCWGWATWKRAWDKFNPDAQALYQQLTRYKLDYEFNVCGSYQFMEMLKAQMEGRIDSWAIRWDASIFLQDMLILYPRQSLVFNDGFNPNGATHTIAETHSYDTAVLNISVDVREKEVKECLVARKAFIDFHNTIAEKSFFRTILKSMGVLKYCRKIKKYIYK